ASYRSFFFQAEDGIRDFHVTGVQTCALPIFAGIGNAYSDEILHVARFSPFKLTRSFTDAEVAALHDATVATLRDAVAAAGGKPRSEERRVGRGCEGRRQGPHLDETTSLS